MARFTEGGGFLAAAVGLTRGLARRALGPMALPLFLGAGLVWLGRSIGDSFVDIVYGKLHIKLGVLFDESIPLEQIASVRETQWSLLGGLGLRTDLRGTVAIATRAGAVAEITFKEPQHLPVLPKLWRARAERLIVSPENLDGFIAELQREIDAAASGEPPAE